MRMVDSDKGRKIARIVIDNDSLGRPGYDNEQTSCDIEVSVGMGVGVGVCVFFSLV